MQTTTQSSTPDPISIRETPESIVIEIAKPSPENVDSQALMEMLRLYLQLYVQIDHVRRKESSDLDDSALADLAESSKSSWWSKNGDHFLRDVDRGR